MRKVSQKASVFILSCIVATSGSAKAAAVISYDSAVQVNVRMSSGYTVGNRFQVGASSIQINSLGAQFLDSTPAIDVGLWSDSGSLIASKNITISDFLENGYRYADLNTTITLAPSTNYYLGAYLPNNSTFIDSQDPNQYNTQPFSGVGVTLNRDVYAGGGSLSFPSATNNVLATRWGPANAAFIDYNPVPGPLPIFGATMGYAWSRRLRKRIKSC